MNKAWDRGLNRLFGDLANWKKVQVVVFPVELSSGNVEVPWQGFIWTNIKQAVYTSLDALYPINH